MSFDQAWAAAGDVDDQQTDNTDPPEPGVYDVALTDFRAFESKQGNEVLVVDWQVIAGPLKDYAWTQLGGFKTEGSAKAAKSMCARLGVNVAQVTSLAQLDQEGKAQIGGYYQVEIVQNGEWRNLYVQQKLQPGGPGTSDLPDNDRVPSQQELDEARAAADDGDTPWD